MGIKKINKLIQAEIEKAWVRGHDAGWEIGYASSLETYSEGVQDGVRAEQERIQTVLSMHSAWALESGKGSEAVMFTKIKEILTPIAIDTSQEAYEKSLEEDGF